MANGEYEVIDVDVQGERLTVKVISDNPNYGEEYTVPANEVHPFISDEPYWRELATEEFLLGKVYNDPDGKFEIIGVDIENDNVDVKSLDEGQNKDHVFVVPLLEAYYFLTHDSTQQRIDGKAYALLSFFFAYFFYVFTVKNKE